MNGYFQLIDIIVIIGAFQGVFLSFSLQKIINKNRKANKILSVLLLIVTIMLLGRFLYFRMFSLDFFHYSLLTDSIIFLFGPLLFNYFKVFLFKGNEKKDLLFYIHFLPFILMFLFGLSTILLYDSQTFYNKNINGDYTLLYKLIIISAILLNLFYVLSCFNLMSKYKKLEKNSFSFKQSPFNYLYYILYSILICLILWMISFLTSTYFSYQFTYITYNSVWITIPIFIYVIGYFSLYQPELFRMPIENKENEKKIRISDTDTALLKQRLNGIMIENKIYLNSELTLKDVSELLQTSNNNISWLLNNIYNTTFYDFINSYRINAFLKKIEEKEHHKKTLLALSYEVGFNSKSTFNRAFKLIHQETPTNFIKKSKF